MFARIRRAVTGQMEQERPQVEDWDIKDGYDSTIGTEELQSLQVEEEAVVGTFDPGYDSDYQAAVVRAAIDAEGKRGNYRIPVWWLKAILADLEGRKYESQPIWDRSELAAREFEVGSLEEADPGYGKLFPGDGAPGGV